MHSDYKVCRQCMITSGYVENVELTKGQEGKTWFIPHHGVYHKDKPGKIRIVFDCSAKFKGICLNDCLYQGPDLNNKLLGVLLRFRRKGIAIQADVESMFYQIQIPIEDRDLMRFLWWKDGNIKNEIQEFRMCAYLFGAVCSPSCANFALKQIANDHQNKFDSITIDTVKNCFYVDDCLTSAPIC